MAERFKYETVWNTPSGTLLFSKRTHYITLHACSDEAATPVFTKGQCYRVISMHPIANPPFVKVIDSHGAENRLEAEQIATWFTRDVTTGYEHENNHER